MKKKMPPASLIRQHLSYDPESGELYWKITTKGRQVGERAGAWGTGNYRVVYVLGTSYKAHRIIWKLVTGREPKDEVDHKDCDRQNNRWVNLREATRLQNLHNASKMQTNTSGLKGVSWNTRDKKWQAHIRANGKQRNLGYFDDPKLAHAAYVAAAKKHFGEFARAK